MDYVRHGEMSDAAILIEQPRHGWSGGGTASRSFASFNRASSLADLAYVAISGLTSRVTRSGSVTSLANIGDVFSDFPGSESPVHIEGHLSRPLVESVCVVLLSSLMYGYKWRGCSHPPSWATPRRELRGLMTSALTLEALPDVVRRHVTEVKAIDMHTHLLPPSHGTGKDSLLLFGIDELLTYRNMPHRARTPG
jgi:hypothetical protein